MVMLRSKLCRQHPLRKTAGFSLAEAVVVMAIIVAISAQVLISFTGLGETAAINRASQGIALSLRKAQNMALAVTPIPGFTVIPPAVGVRFDLVSPGEYLFFADRKDVVAQDFQYTPGAGDPERIATSTFERGVRINRLLDQNNTTYTVAHILFSNPESTIFLTRSDGTSIPGTTLSVELINAIGKKKTIIVRTSGQIQIE